MPAAKYSIEWVITRVEEIKSSLNSCEKVSDLIHCIDETMELLIAHQKSEFVSQSVSGDLYVRLRYLREIRASALDLSDEQVPDFCRDLKLIFSSMQFQLWRGDSKELLALIDSHHS